MSDEDQGTFTPPRPAIPSRAKGDVPLPTADVYADVAKVARAKKPRKPRAVGKHPALAAPYGKKRAVKRGRVGKHRALAAPSFTGDAYRLLNEMMDLDKPTRNLILAIIKGLSK